MNKKIAIIGMGHMGKAFYDGLVFAGVNEENILASDSSKDNKKIAAQADWIILAVKPLIVAEVISEIKQSIQDKIVMSVAAAITIASMTKDVANSKQKIIRLMPNLPVAYGQGVIGFFASDSVSETEKNEIVTVLSGLGSVIVCEQEGDLEGITILAGSGPAVVAYCLSLFEQTGKSLGFEEEQARKIAYQTFLGTLAHLRQTGQTAEQLQQTVATKGGITEQIINYLEEEKISSTFQKSFEAGYARIKKIREELEK